MLNKLKGKINKYSNFLLAYSGGLDSTVLLDQLIKLRDFYNLNLKIRAIHINHGINAESDNWVQHCQKKCNYYKIPLLIKYINLDIKKNIEKEARLKRYNIFEKTLKKEEILLTAHHLIDQCETVLLALKRGSGIVGLSGIPYTRKIGKNLLLRPFLDKTKTELKQWALKYKLSWIEDSSNNDIKYDRNFLRNIILPVIFKKWPSFYLNVNRSSEICREQENLLNELLLPILDKMINNDGSLSTDNFDKMSHAYRNFVLRKWIINKVKIIPSRNFINILWKEVINSKPDASPKLNIQKYEIRRYRKNIYLIKKYISLKNYIIIWKNPRKNLLLPQNLGSLCINNKGMKIRKPLLNEIINIRFQCNNKVDVCNFFKRKKIKKIWQENNVPIWERNRIPMLFYNKELIAVIGFFVTKKGFCVNKNYSWKIYWNKNNTNMNNSLTFDNEV